MTTHFARTLRENRYASAINGTADVFNHLQQLSVRAIRRSLKEKCTRYESTGRQRVREPLRCGQQVSNWMQNARGTTGRYTVASQRRHSHSVTYPRQPREGRDRSLLQPTTGFGHRFIACSSNNTTCRPARSLLHTRRGSHGYAHLGSRGL